MNENWYKSIPIYNNQQPRTFENFTEVEKFEDEEFEPNNNSLIGEDLKNKIIIDYNNKVPEAKEKKENIDKLLKYDRWERISDLFQDYELFPPELDSDNFDQNEI